MNLIHTEILCSIRRLLPGDLKIAFVGPGQGQTFDIDDNVFGEKIELNDTKGGVNLNEYLTFNSLVNTGEELQQRCVDHLRVVLFSKNTSLLPYFFTHATIDPSDLNLFKIWYMIVNKAYSLGKDHQNVVFYPGKLALLLKDLIKIWIIISESNDFLFIKYIKQF